MCNTIFIRTSELSEQDLNKLFDVYNETIRCLIDILSMSALISQVKLSQLQGVLNYFENRLNDILSVNFKLSLQSLEKDSKEFDEAIAIIAYKSLNYFIKRHNVLLGNKLRLNKLKAEIFDLDDC